MITEQTEIKAISITEYDLEVIPANEKAVDDIENILMAVRDDHGDNFQTISSIADSELGQIQRKLTASEGDKIYDLNINGQFDEAEELENTLKSQWQAVFIQFM